jgi:DNA-binding LacI/PurR family transcriptional regulator
MHDASRVTIQKALDRLQKDGYVVAQRRLGTFVSENPPHLSRFGLAFSVNPEANPAAAPLCRALYHAVQRFNAASTDRFECYFNISPHDATPERERLVDDVINDRLAGLIATDFDTLDVVDALRQNHDFPALRFVGGPSRENISEVLPNQWPILTRGLDYLAGQGCWRVGVLGILQAPYQFEQVCPEVERRGMEIKRHWLQLIHQSGAESARQVAHLMMHADPACRPDGLIIANAHLVSQATTGLVLAGVRVPDELEVVAHCVRPWPVESSTPVTWIGFQAEDFLTHALNTIRDWRAGHREQRSACLIPKFDNELDTTEQPVSAAPYTMNKN